MASSGLYRLTDTGLERRAPEDCVSLRRHFAPRLFLLLFLFPDWNSGARIRMALNRYRQICTKVDASIFGSALSHTRRSEPSEKKRKKILGSTLVQFPCRQVSSPRLYRLKRHTVLYRLKFFQASKTHSLDFRLIQDFWTIRVVCHRPILSPSAKLRIYNCTLKCLFLIFDHVFSLS